VSPTNRSMSGLERLARRARRDLRRVADDHARRTLRRSAPTDPPQMVYLHGFEDARPRVPWPAFPPRGYLGQLDPAFQSDLAASRSYVTRDDCNFYHVSELPTGEVIPGAWDLRGGEPAYIGGVMLTGKTVLELGPATGALTWYMESEGADVTCFEVGYDCSVNLLPRPGIDEAWAKMDVMRFIGTVQNSWWYLHRELGSSARAVYGNIYWLPADIGDYDIVTLGTILLHLRDPFAAIEQAAAHARRLVVTELIQDPELDRDENLLRFAPQAVEHPTNWWSFTPGTIVRMLERVGFSKTATTYHTQRHHLGHDLDKPAVEMEMFTVVAERPEG
jgi:Methyltransferase domain